MRGGGRASGRRKSRHPGKGVIPPCAVIVGAAHRLAELAVVGNVDAELALLLDHVRNRRGEALRIGGIAFAFADGNRLAHGDQVRRPRQAAGMGGENAIGTAFHDPGSNVIAKLNGSGAHAAAPAHAALRDDRQDEARGVRAVVMERVGAHQRRMIRMRENAVGCRQIAIGELEADAVALLEYIRDRQHLDVELVDLAGL